MPWPNRCSRSQWADEFRQASAPHLESVRPLNALAKRVRLVFAAGGVEALSVLRKTRPDLILMDIMMPDMDGLEVMRQMKTVPRLADIPIIMITGKSEKNIVTESLKAGATGFVVKPFARDTLLGKVAKVLRGT